MVYGNFIDGAFVAAERTFPNLNPARKTDIVGVFPLSGSEEAASAITAAERAFESWKALSPISRGEYLVAMAHALRAHGDEIAAAITREQGKPLVESQAELCRTVAYLDYYGKGAYELGGRTLPSARPYVEIFLRREPVGVAALVTPWNVPLAGPARKIAPALVCGNTVVVKPSMETPLSCHFLAEAAVEAGLPGGVLNVVHGDGPTAGGAIVRDPRVKAISFTGSTEVGRELAKVGAERLVRVQLELGGKNAAIILDDCDLELAVDQIVLAGFGASGQQCTATSRVLVLREMLGRFTELLVRRAQALTVGPGTDPRVNIGPLVSERQLRTVLGYVETGSQEGAELLTGGGQLTGDAYDGGWFMPPTIFASVEPDMCLAREEIFGPVVAIMPVDSDDEAVAVANDTQYGLSAAVYTRSLSRAHRFIRDLEVGAVAVNLPSAGWEIQTAFGGTKASGGTGWKDQGPEALGFFSELKAAQVLPV